MMKNDLVWRKDVIDWLAMMSVPVQRIDRAKSPESLPSASLQCGTCDNYDATKGRCKRFSFPPFGYCFMDPDDFCSKHSSLL